MTTAVLIVAGSGDFVGTDKEIYHMTAIKKLFDMSSFEWLSKSLFEAGVSRIAVCGEGKKVELAKLNCKRLFVEFVFNPKGFSNHLVNGLRYL
ncbi:MAG: hypothetical protein LBM98_06280 [Oscillospiraceae bacterium]|jgi:hypothetical protein|nr:hypothetical protein [Oscillospiraceae bacterium]